MPKKSKFQTQSTNKVRIGSVFQINNNFAESKYVGAFIVATEIYDWGIKGYIHNPSENQNPKRIMIEAKYEELYLIGETILV